MPLLPTIKLDRGVHVMHLFYSIDRVRWSQLPQGTSVQIRRALESDPDMGDLASYKIFLCDLFGGHEDVAKKELDAFNATGSKPSYYYSNAAWSLFHKNTEDARSWLVSALRIYPAQKNEFYQSSLKDLGYLPLPAPPPGK